MIGDPGRITVSTVMLEIADTYTVASGVLTPQQSLCVVNGEGAANDDIVTITPGSKLIKTGYVAAPIYLTAKIGQTHNIKHGTGNIKTNTGADIVLTENKMVILVPFVVTTTGDVANFYRAIG